MKKKRVIVWFRQDLRLHDNEALRDALNNGQEVIPVYIFDERVFKARTKLGFHKTGKYRAKFIIESIKDLRNNLQKLGSNLYVRIGKPEELIFDIAQKSKSGWVFCNRERTQEEIDVQDSLEKKLWSIGQEVRYSRGKMLYYTSDLPFPVTHCPDTFTNFRKEVEKFIPIRNPLDSPKEEDFAPLSYELAPGDIPNLEDFGHSPFEADTRAVFNFKGGETAALEHLQHYIWETESIIDYYDAKNDSLLNKDASSKFSPWLAQGCLSPKKVYQVLKKFELNKTKNKSTYELFLALLWRDFFRLMGKKHGNTIFLKNGPQGKSIKKWKNDFSLFNKWKEGKTGTPFIDASMKELTATGYLSHRGRQNTASFLVNDLKVNWKWGASYFESALIDYDTCSNWGNWNCIAGVGSDVKENRCLNVIAQSKKYDSKGKYIKQWLPELSTMPIEKLHDSYTTNNSIHA